MSARRSPPLSKNHSVVCPVCNGNVNLRSNGNVSVHSGSVVGSPWFVFVWTSCTGSCARFVDLTEAVVAKKRAEMSRACAASYLAAAESAERQAKTYRDGAAALTAYTDKLEAAIK